MTTGMELSEGGGVADVDVGESLVVEAPEDKQDKSDPLATKKLLTIWAPKSGYSSMEAYIVYHPCGTVTASHVYSYALGSTSPLINCTTVRASESSFPVKEVGIARAVTPLFEIIGRVMVREKEESSVEDGASDWVTPIVVMVNESAA